MDPHAGQGATMKDLDRIFKEIDNSTEDIISLQTMLTAEPALSPENGGQGEYAKARVLTQWLEKNEFTDIRVIDVPDKRVETGVRPNIIAAVEGQDSSRTCWIMSHLDIVPPGEKSLWKNDPYSVVEKDGKLFGRGVEDNQQGVVASVMAARAFLKTGITPKHPLKLLFVADEETGSDFGIKYLIKESRLFDKDDWFLIPDGGRSDGTMLEVAEKSILWIKFHTQGVQCHASMPEQGVNAFLAGSDLVLRLSSLKETYDGDDPIFDPPVSTFMPTRKDANVPNINTIPGDDVFFMDMRILPSYDVERVLKDIRRMCDAVENRYGVTISFDIIQKVESVPTPADAPLVISLQKAIDHVYRVSARPVGIGGGTVGAFLRNEGLETVVWSRIDETAHMPNEYSILDNLRGDAKVMAVLALDP